jgi:hypothetical protein
MPRLHWFVTAVVAVPLAAAPPAGGLKWDQIAGVISGEDCVFHKSTIFDGRGKEHRVDLVFMGEKIPAHLLVGPAVMMTKEKKHWLYVDCKEAGGPKQAGLQLDRVLSFG